MNHFGAHLVAPTDEGDATVCFAQQIRNRVNIYKELVGQGFLIRGERNKYFRLVEMVPSD